MNASMPPLPAAAPVRCRAGRGRARIRRRRLAVDRGLEQAVQRVGLGLAGLVDLGDDRRRGLDAPAHGFEDQLQFGGGELDVGFFERGVDAVTEDVVVLEQIVAERLAERRGDFDQAAVALPGLGVEQLLFLLLGQALLRCRPLRHRLRPRRCPIRPGAFPARPRPWRTW